MQQPLKPFAQVSFSVSLMPTVIPGRFEIGGGGGGGGLLLAGLNECGESCFTECFTILDTAASGFQLKIKETIEKPILNQ